jgi:Ran GTPase-activating protein (RanGAP) involved in mRNA processing and transport
LTKVTLNECEFGSEQDASQHFASFHTNRTVVDLTIHRIHNLEGAALGNSLSGLMENMPQLRLLDCDSYPFVEVVRGFQAALRMNRTWRELTLSDCYMGNEGIRIVVDALAGNSTMDALDLSCNAITDVGLADISRTLELTQLKKIVLWGNEVPVVFSDQDKTQHFCLYTTTEKVKCTRATGIKLQKFP